MTNLHWSGKVRREPHPPVEGDAYLDWDGTLVLCPDFDQYNEEGQRGIIAHEMMHAVSNSGDVTAYIQHAMFEEGLAEALAIQWRSEHDVRTHGAYALAVQGIDMLADLIGMPRQQFYEVMLATPLDQRPAKVLALALSRPTHENLIGPGFADPREAILFTIAWMEPDVDDAGAIVKLLHRVRAETGYGPARMRILMENLITQPIGNWMGIIDRAASERNVNIMLWLDPTVDPVFPFTSRSLRASISDRIGDALGRAIGGALNAPPPTPFNPYSAQARRVKRPKPVKRPSFLFTRRVAKGRIGIGGNAPPEEPVTRRTFGAMLTPPGAV